MTYLKSHSKIMSQADLNSRFMAADLVSVFPYYSTFQLPH